MTDTPRLTLAGTIVRPTRRSRPRVALDCDGVLSDFAGYVLPLINARLGTAYTLDDWTTWSPKECFGDRGHEVYRAMWASCPDGSHVSAMAPIPGAVAAVNRLAERFDVHVVTAMREDWREARIAWLARHGFGVVGVHCAEGPKKIEVCRSLGAVAFADDKAATVNAMAGVPGLSVYLVDSHANRLDRLVPGVLRGSLAHVVDRVLAGVTA